MIEVQNCFQGYDSQWNWGSRTDTRKLSNKCHARLVKEAREHFDGLGLDFGQYGGPVVTLSDGETAQVEWMHLASQRTLTLTHIWFDKKTGEILQCGTNYEGLVS